MQNLSFAFLSASANSAVTVMFGAKDAAEPDQDTHTQGFRSEYEELSCG